MAETLGIVAAGAALGLLLGIGIFFAGIVIGITFIVAAMNWFANRI